MALRNTQKQGQGRVANRKNENEEECGAEGTKEKVRMQSKKNDRGIDKLTEIRRKMQECRDIWKGTGKENQPRLSEGKGLGRLCNKIDSRNARR